MEEGYDSTSDNDNDNFEVLVAAPPKTPPVIRLFQCPRCHQVFSTRERLQEHFEMHIGKGSSSSTKRIKTQHGVKKCIHTAKGGPSKATTELNLFHDPLKLTLAPPPVPPPSLDLTLATGMDSGFGNSLKLKGKVEANQDKINIESDDHKSGLDLKLSPPWKKFN